MACFSSWYRFIFYIEVINLDWYDKQLWHNTLSIDIFLISNPKPFVDDLFIFKMHRLNDSLVLLEFISIIELHNCLDSLLVKILDEISLCRNNYLPKPLPWIYVSFYDLISYLGLLWRIRRRRNRNGRLHCYRLQRCWFLWYLVNHPLDCWLCNLGMESS